MPPIQPSRPVIELMTGVARAPNRRPRTKPIIKPMTAPTTLTTMASTISATARRQKPAYSTGAGPPRTNVSTLLRRILLGVLGEAAAWIAEGVAGTSKRLPHSRHADVAAGACAQHSGHLFKVPTGFAHFGHAAARSDTPLPHAGHKTRTTADASYRRPIIVSPKWLRKHCTRSGATYQ